MINFNWSILFIFVFMMSCGDFGKMYDIVDIDENYKNGNIELAKVQIEDYLSKNKDNEFAWTIKGHIYSDFYDFQTAEESYNQALLINPETVEAITGLGIISRLQENYEEAEKYYLKAIKIDPKYAYAYSSLVAVMLQSKNYKKAVEYGQKGFDLEKNDAVIAANLAVAYHFYGDDDNKMKYLTIAKDLGYDNIEDLQNIFDGSIQLFE